MKPAQEGRVAGLAGRGDYADVNEQGEPDKTGSPTSMMAWSPKDFGGLRCVDRRKQLKAWDEIYYWEL